MSSARRYRPWYHGWNIVALCALGETMALALTINCASLFMPLWTREFGVPVSTIATGFTLFSLTTTMISYLAGVCAARYPARLVFGLAFALLGAVHLMVAGAHHVWQILAIYGLALPFAISFSASVPSQALVSRWFTRRVGLAMGLTAAGLALPGLLFPPIIIALLRVMNWRHIWIGQGAAVLLFVLPAALLLLRDRPDAGDPAGYVARPAPVARADGAIALRRIVVRPNFVIIMVAFLCAQFIPMSLYVNITPIIRSYGGTSALAGLFLMTFSLAALVAKLTAGWASDRMGNHVPLVIAVIGTGAGALLLAIPQTQSGILVLAAITIGFSGATWTLLASSMLAEFGMGSFGRAYGLASAIAPLSTLSAPVLARVQEMTGSYTLPLGMVGILAILSGIGVLILFRPQPALVPAMA